MTSVLVRMASVAALMLRRSLPAISGAFSIAHRLKWARDSVSDRPLPTSSMSGSFQRARSGVALQADLLVEDAPSR